MPSSVVSVAVYSCMPGLVVVVVVVVRAAGAAGGAVADSPPNAPAAPPSSEVMMMMMLRRRRLSIDRSIDQSSGLSGGTVWWDAQVCEQAAWLVYACPALTGLRPDDRRTNY
jgi:hypothetical protein